MGSTTAGGGLQQGSASAKMGIRAEKFAVAAYVLHIIAFFQCGGFFLDAGRRVLSLNPVAAASLGSALVLRGDRLAATDRESDARLQNAVEFILNLDGSAEVPAASVEIQRSGRLPLIARLLRLEESVRPALNGANVLLITLDPQIRQTPPSSLVRRVFDLTPTEAEVAIGIADGKPLALIAEERGAKIDTVRVHSKKVFAKTQTAGQVELAALLARFAVMMPESIESAEAARDLCACSGGSKTRI